MMNNPNFEQQFNEKIKKIRRLLESLPRFASNSELSESYTADSSSDSSMNDNKYTPKIDYGELLQSEYLLESIHDSLMSEPQSCSSHAGLPKKKKKKRRTIDPLRPTKKRSFGVDIGQGINTIRYIKENCCPTTETRTNRLMNIFMKPIPTLKSDKSMENVYRQLPLSQESSRSNVHSRIEQAKRPGEPEHRELSVLFGESEEDTYRVRYKDYTSELPNDYGVEDLQALFVPYNDMGAKKRKSG